MNVVWGVILIIISSLGWLGQVITALNPTLGEKLGVTEPEADVDPTFHTDVRGEAYWDAVILWTLPVGGLLLVLNNQAWIYFGLVGGGMYLYFAGRGILVRRVMQQNGIRIGAPEALKVNYIYLALSGLTAAITIVMAIAAIPIS